MKRALITGITGQDGSYLAEKLLEEGYEVHGIKRRSSSFNTQRIDHLGDAIHLHYGDMTDGMGLMHIMQDVAPDEIYNLAAQSHVQVSFETPEYTANADGLGTMRILECVRTLGLKDARIYQASTSELYGNSGGMYRNEETPFMPRSPYAAAKLYGFWITRNYREAYGLHATNGILFNHESPRRGPTFVTRKITRAVAAIHKGEQDCMYLGNIDAIRDWGHAKDYVEAMYLALQQPKPDDYVIATGEAHSVRQFIEAAFDVVGIVIGWQGEGVNETAVNRMTGQTVVRINPKYFRPTEVDLLRGDATKAMNALGWRPRCSFFQLVDEMVRADLNGEKPYDNEP